MRRITVTFPEELRLHALRRARERGISFGALVRESLEVALASSTTRTAEADPLFADSAV